MAIALFFFGHWFTSLFFQTFFLHRYASHAMFGMSKFWERVFFLLTFITQGSSFLNPRAYAIMHRRHHAYSDTEDDPHSPHYSRTVWGMMAKTYKEYEAILEKKDENDPFGKNVPEWKGFEERVPRWPARIFFGVFYILFYVYFATNPYQFLLLPIHFLMGPIHGSIVNWCGHKYGYVNHRETRDYSKNTLPMDFLMLGELFQNNHHRYPARSNFAVRWFEFDPAYPLMRLLHLLGIIHLRPQREDAQTVS